MTPSPGPGQQIGRYRLERQLGRGAMGQVFLAEDTVLGQPVCLKVLHPQFLHHPEAVARFTRELVLARRIAHPGVCRVYDLHDEGGLRFLTMEYVDGAPLLTLVGRGAPIVSVARALRLTRSLCLGLAAAHDKGVIHRDLKPGNVMVRAGSDDEVCILDFGIAAAADTVAQGLTRPGVALGTRLYIAPEVWAGQPATARSDLFAVGVILFRLLTGEMPWAGSEDDINVFERMQGTPPRRPSSLRPEAGAAIDELVGRALAVDPAARVPDAATFVAAVDRILATHAAAQTGWEAPTRVERAAHVIVAEGTSSSAPPGGTRPRPVTMATLPSSSSLSPASSAEMTRSVTDPLPADDERTREALPEPPHTSGEDSWVVSGRPVGNPVRPKVMEVAERPAPRPLSPPTAATPSSSGPRRLVAAAVAAIALAGLAVALWPGNDATPPPEGADTVDAPAPPTDPVPEPPVPAVAPVDVAMPAPPSDPLPTPEPAPADPPAPIAPPPPAPPVEAPPKKVPARSTSQAKKDASQALKDIVGAMRTRGLITGDDVELDRLRRSAVRAHAGRRYDVALEGAEAAIARAAVVRIDRALVEKKLTRFNDAFDREKSATKRVRLDEIAGRASLDFAAGRLDAANRALNEGFALLGKDR